MFNIHDILKQEYMYKTHMYMYIFENMLKFLLIEVSVKEQNDGFRHN